MTPLLKNIKIIQKRSNANYIDKIFTFKMKTV